MHETCFNEEIYRYICTVNKVFENDPPKIVLTSTNLVLSKIFHRRLYVYSSRHQLFPVPDIWFESKRTLLTSQLTHWLFLVSEKNHSSTKAWEEERPADRGACNHNS